MKRMVKKGGEMYAWQDGEHIVVYKKAWKMLQLKLHSQHAVAQSFPGLECAARLVWRL